MIGDFNDSANPLWTLYGKEAKRYDESQIQTLKDDMDGVLIFVRSYSVFYDGLGHVDAWTLRRVYFQLPSPHSLSVVFRICRQTPRNKL